MTMKKILLIALMIVGISASAQTNIEAEIGGVYTTAGFGDFTSETTLANIGIGLSAGDGLNRIGFMVNGLTSFNGADNTSFDGYMGTSYDRFINNSAVGFGLKVWSPFENFGESAIFTPRVTVATKDFDIVVGYNFFSPESDLVDITSFSAGLVFKL